MLINLSNHPSEKWSDKQLAAAKKQFGEIEDWPFPQIDPNGTLEEVREIVTGYVDKCIKLKQDTDATITVHIMGEMNFVYYFVRCMEGHGIPCVASTSERTVIEEGDGKKTVVFNFRQFRSYFKIDR